MLVYVAQQKVSCKKRTRLLVVRHSDFRGGLEGEAPSKPLPTRQLLCGRPLVQPSKSSTGVVVCCTCLPTDSQKGALMAGPQPRSITVSAAQRTLLERLLRQHSCPQALAVRVRIILHTADGARIEPLAVGLHCAASTVQKWRDRWADAEARLAAAEADAAQLTLTVAATLADAPRSGRPPVFSAEQIVQLVNLACTSPRTLGRPVDAWTPRELADEAERQGIVSCISPSSVERFLGRSRSATASQPLLAQCQDQSR